jgi:hypothetical protein
MNFPVTRSSGTATDELDHSPAHILSEYIIANLNLMTDPESDSAWPLFVGFLPDDSPSKIPVSAGAIYDTPGVKNVKVSSGQMITKHGVMLKIRSQVYTVGWSKLKSIYKVTDATNNEEVIIDSATYNIQNISRLGTPMALGPGEDTKRASQFTVNFLVTIQQLV